MYVFVRKVIIRNFKSIGELELELRPGVNLLVGPNGAGKSNVLEAIRFARRALVEAASPYLPYAPDYLSPLDVIYGRDPRREVALGFGLELYGEEGGEWLSAYAEFTTYFRYRPQPYETIEPVRHVVKIGDTQAEIDRGGVTITAPREHFDRAMKWIKEHGKRILPLPFKLAEPKEEGDRTVVSYRWDMEVPLQLEGLRHVLWPGPRGRASEDLLACSLVARRTLTPFPVALGRAKRPRGVPVDLSPWFCLDGVLDAVRGVLWRVVFLRHVERRVEPVPIAGGDVLDERGRNVAAVLFSYRGRFGRNPESVDRALAALFPGVLLEVRQLYNSALLVAREGDVELPPSNIPDGLLKLVVLMLAVDLGPSLLLVDEVENSMHARLLEYVVDVFNGLNVPVLLATHSPVVVDLVDLERIYFLSKGPGGTRAEAVPDPEELRRRLGEAGVAISDYFFYTKRYGR
ncbi:AAA family ATPase [Thermoproteus tenax]|uniref:DNA repair ATPase, RecF family n=1 Tax=Thermoproteus tenax (strain ATCC 35583 / DSM 2078 / JCM 9277 / NBRC 100435 / Kra 1) TaxID=768679 RepID=G4RNA3_THETK|nr:ATP-binding protein [Thermoproteus tenax]CCC81047.1 DNA repair ATPase, RecF family [Thermoproteus tenax Kra 1]